MGLLIPLSRGNEPLYRQIYVHLRSAILSGALRGGERLPSSRDLADHLGVSRTIVVLAYDQLSAEGFIGGRSGSGTYVAQTLPPSTKLAPAATARIRLSRFGAHAEEAVSRVNIPAATDTAPVRYDFAYARSDVEVFPFATWRRVLMRNARKASTRDLDYGPAAGNLALREAIAAHLRRARAVVCDASQVVVVNGSQQGLDLIARVLIQPGDPVVIEDPHYQGTREVLRGAGAKLRPSRVDGEGLDPASLPKSARIACVTPSHQFPTGAILPLSRRVALLDWAERAGAVLVEDDYDGEFRYDGHALESLQGLDTQGRVIYMGTFSRTVFSALRIGYLVVPKSLVNVFTAAKWLSDRHTATLEQRTLAEFISEGMYERHLRHLRKRNSARRQVLLAAIDAQLGDRVDVTGDGAGTHVVLWPRTRCSEDTVVRKAAAAGVRVYGISQYFLGEQTRVGLIIGYARTRESEIKEGIARIANVL